MLALSSRHLAGFEVRSGPMPSRARYVAAVDQGTTGSRCILFDHQGTIVSADYLEHTQIYPEPGWVEHDALEIWARVESVIRGALDRAGAEPADIAAVGVTNQRETAVIWDRKTGRPIHNAIVWQDTRTLDLVQRWIDDGFEPELKAKTGLVAATYFSAGKIRWILDHVEGAQARAEAGELAFGNTDSWIIWCLSGGARGGGHVTDYTNASRTLLMDLRTLDWDDELLRYFDIPRSLLPEIRPSSDPELLATTSAGGPFGAAIPIAGDLGDQQAAVFGQTCFRAGEAKNTYGTGSFVLLNTGPERASSKTLLSTVAYQLADQPAHYALEGSIAVTGALIQWLRDRLGLISSAAEVEQLAASVEDNGDVYIVPAFSGLFAPYWREDARGVIVGLTAYANRGHIARAALEAAAWQSREVVDEANSAAAAPLAELRVDGGMTANSLLMQLQADFLGVPVVRPVVSETTALGAAFAAGLAVGFWRDLDELRERWREDRRWEPQLDAADRERRYARWKKAVTRSFDWVEPDPL
jgi:glycerol kinase